MGDLTNQNEIYWAIHGTLTGKSRDMTKMKGITQHQVTMIYIYIHIDM